MVGSQYVDRILNIRLPPQAVPITLRSPLLGKVEGMD